MLRKHIELILFFLVITFLSLGNIENICKIYTSLTFDNQALLTWDYTASIGMIPYKDIFYPYGLLQYLKNQNLIFSFTYFFLTPILFTGIFLTLRQLFKNRFCSYFSFFIFFLFILKITGFETFNRYGVLVLLSFFFSYLFFYSKNRINELILLSGIGVGIIFSLIYDQGIYGIILFLVYLILDVFLRKNENKFSRSLLIRKISQVIIFFGGFCIGITPFVYYLIRNQAFFPFIAYLKSVSDISIYAKTPFFHSIGSFENIFAIMALFIGIFFLAYKLIIVRQKASFSTYIQLGLISVLILLEQKNIIRSIDIQLTFIGLLLYLSFFSELLNVLQKNKSKKRKQLFFYTSALCIFIFLLLFKLSSSFNISLQIPSLNNIIKAFQTINENTCIEENLKSVPEIYKNVKNEIEKDPKFNGKVFSFPGDPLFYIIFNQKPPYYPSIYEGTPLYAQKRSIDFIKNQEIQYIIYNYKNAAIQDEVPNYIRTQLLHEYIINNFLPEKRMENFLILRYQKNRKDFFEHGQNTLSNYLLNVNLMGIPRSEGYHKAKYLRSNDEIVHSSSLNEFNKNLQNKHIDSNKKVLVFFFREKRKKEMVKVDLKTKDGYTTQVRFYNCSVNSPCIINLSHIPLFYRDRILDNVSSSNTNIEAIKLFKISADAPFW